MQQHHYLGDLAKIVKVVESEQRDVYGEHKAIEAELNYLDLKINEVIDCNAA